MRILVTGGAGYVGSVVTEELVARGHEVVVYDNLSKGHRDAVEAGVPFVLGDLLDADLLRDTLRTLFAHKLRTLLTMFGIAWGIVSITLMVAAGEGLRVGQARVAENFGRDVMIVFSGRTSLQAGGLRAGRKVQWTATDHIEVQKQSPACGYVMPELGNPAPVRSAFNSASLTVTGSMPDFAYIRSIPVAEGRYPDWEDERQVRRVAFLGSDAKKQLFASRPAIGEKIRVGDFPYTVVGVMRHKEQDSSYDGQDINKVFVPFSAVLRDFPNKHLLFLHHQRPPLPQFLLSTVQSRLLPNKNSCPMICRRLSKT